jgi:hypothetical protein
MKQSCDERSKAAVGLIWAGAIVVTRLTAGGKDEMAATILGIDRGGDHKEDAAVGIGVPRAPRTRSFRRSAAYHQCC